MNALLQQLKNPKYKLSLILLAGLILFMQCYLLQHKVEHHHDHHAEHDTNEIIQDCQLCWGAQQANQFILTTIHNISLSLMVIFIVSLCHAIVFCSPAFVLPQTRAPPRP